MFRIMSKIIWLFFYLASSSGGTFINNADFKGSIPRERIYCKKYILEVFDKSVVNVNDLVYFYKYNATMN